MKDEANKLIELGYFHFIDEGLIATVKSKLLSALLSDSSFVSTLNLDSYVSRCEENISQSYLVSKTFENTSFFHDLKLDEMCGLPVRVSLDLRVVYLDLEKLANGYADEVLNTLYELGVLKKCGVEIEKIAKFDTGDGYDLFVNGSPYTILTTEAMDLWEDAVFNVINMLNELLQEAGSLDRAYRMGRDAQTKICFLTRGLFEYLTSLDLRGDWKISEV